MAQPPPQVLEVVQRVDLNRAAYCSPHYNETQLRDQFLDPFFGLTEAEAKLLEEATR